MVVLDRLAGTIEASRGGWLGEVMVVVTHARVRNGDPHKNL